MPYLYASAVISISPRMAGLGPTTLALLADMVTERLNLRERFTVYLDWRRWTAVHLRGDCALKARRVASSLIAAVRCRPSSAGLHAKMISHNRFQLVLRFTPADEWHPATSLPGQPLTVVCDASFVDARNVRAGIATGDTVTTVDLSGTGCDRSSNAEFLTLCLALLTGVRERGPLTVYADETEAVRAGLLLREGQFPPWVYRHGDDLTQRITLAAMTACRLRPVHIEHLPRERVGQAHQAADATIANAYMLSPRTWAVRQGMNLSWLDSQRGLDHHVPATRLFQSRPDCLP
ncbi:hypothetical protein OG241_08195 [Streptomyces sp. NBC_01390]|uniref:hypothetical protein n=1 Tax=Streptomyces sp. NBC_01390 TaxID=2903850 RepID=UPI00324A5FBF